MYTPGFTKPTHGYGLEFGDATAEGGGEEDMGVEAPRHYQTVVRQPGVTLGMCYCGTTWPCPEAEPEENWAGKGFEKKADD